MGFKVGDLGSRKGDLVSRDGDLGSGEVDLFQTGRFGFQGCPEPHRPDSNL